MRKQPKPFIVEVKRRRAYAAIEGNKPNWLVRAVRRLPDGRPPRIGHVTAT